MKIRLIRSIRFNRMMLLSACITTVFGVLALSFTKNGPEGVASGPHTQRDSIISQRAFLQVYKVLMSPRCMNCHPSGDVPLQGDDSHLHLQGVKRGPGGRGVYALRCSNCHQAANTPGLNMPPGVPDWHLPPPTMRMVFQGRSPHDLALQMLDPKQNGGKSRKDLIEHMKTDLVRWAWQPGEGRTRPPLSYEDFVTQFKLWIDKGAVAPPVGAQDGRAYVQDGRVLQLAKLEIDPAQLDSYKAYLREGIETALKLEPGVLMLYAVAEKRRPTHITIVEIYADSAAYRAHLQTTHFLRYKSATAAMVKHLELTPVTPVYLGIQGP